MIVPEPGDGGPRARSISSPATRLVVVSSTSEHLARRTGCGKDEWVLNAVIPGSREVVSELGDTRTSHILLAFVNERMFPMSLRTDPSVPLHEYGDAPRVPMRRARKARDRGVLAEYTSASLRHKLSQGAERNESY